MYFDVTNYDYVRFVYKMQQARYNESINLLHISSSKLNYEEICMQNPLIVYFSAGGKTRKLAETLSVILNCDIFEIVPEIPYTQEDLDWRNKESRSSIEMTNLSFRPKIAAIDLNTTKYDVILLGFPIWWYIAPTIVNTFLESYDFKGKTIIPFATSGGSLMGDTILNLKSSVDDTVQFSEGRVFSLPISSSSLRLWLDSLDI